MEVIQETLRSGDSRSESRAVQHHSRLDASGSVLDGLDAKSLEVRKVVLHGSKLLGRVPLPIGDFAHDPKRVTGAI